MVSKELLELAADVADGKPIGYVTTIDPDKHSYRKDSWVPWKEVVGLNGGKISDSIPDGTLVYLQPTQKYLEMAALEKNK